MAWMLLRGAMESSCLKMHLKNKKEITKEEKEKRRRSFTYLLVQSSGSRPLSIAAFSAGSPKASQPIGFNT